MKVKSIREHTNAYEPAGKKAVGTEYELPENTAQVLIDAKLVEAKAEKKS